jgi:hypothetical protein
MTRQHHATSPGRSVAALAHFGPSKVPTDYITIEAEAQPSKHYACGTEFIKALAHGRDLAPDHFAPLGFSCYDVAPATSLTLTISFKSKERLPKGLLRLRTDRGKLSDSFIQLDGKRKQIEIQYTAPDETIKVSIRAFLDGYGRGKAHFHLG